MTDRRWDGEHCQNCGRPYATVHKIPDEIWKEISGEYNLLCIPCIDYLVHKKGYSIYWNGEIQEDN